MLEPSEHDVTGGGRNPFDDEPSPRLPVFTGASGDETPGSPANPFSASPPSPVPITACRQYSPGSALHLEHVADSRPCSAANSRLLEQRVDSSPLGPTDAMNAGDEADFGQGDGSVLIATCGGPQCDQEESDAAATPSIRVQCGGCQYLMMGPATGGMLQCPKCETTIQVPPQPNATCGGCCHQFVGPVSGGLVKCPGCRATIQLPPQPIRYDELLYVSPWWRQSVLPQDEAIPFLEQFGCFAAGAATASAWGSRMLGNPAARPQLALSVLGHEHRYGHTWYVLKAVLREPKGSGLEWMVPRRLGHLRECLYERVKTELGISYDAHFSGSRFAYHGGVPGTTERLSGWCRALACYLNGPIATPYLVAVSLRFLEAPCSGLAVRPGTLQAPSTSIWKGNAIADPGVEDGYEAASQNDIIVDGRRFVNGRRFANNSATEAAASFAATS